MILLILTTVLEPSRDVFVFKYNSAGEEIAMGKQWDQFFLSLHSE